MEDFFAPGESQTINLTFGNLQEINVENWWKLMRIENRFYIDDILDCYNMSQMLHVRNIYIHLAESNDKCR